MKTRRLASGILSAAIRRAPPELREWGNAMLHEIDFIEGDWAPLRWAIGGTIALLRPVDLPIKELSEVPARFESLQKKMRRNQFVGYATCVFLMAGCSRNFFVVTNTFQRVGSILTVLGAGFLGFQIYLNHFQKKAAVMTSASTSVLATVDRYRAVLQRLRDFHCGIWFWSRLIVFLPGPLLFLVGFRITHPEFARTIWNDAIVFLALGVFAIPLNLWMARKYRRKIEQLDRLRNEQR
jgi:hypothetical protein